MNDEQTKRIADAADAVLSASDALDEARDLLTDRRFDSDIERERLAAGQQLASRIDSAGKRIEDAVRRATVAAAAAGRPNAFARNREAAAAAREGRLLGRIAPDQDGTANKRERSTAAIGRLDAALAIAAALVFGD